MKRSDLEKALADPRLREDALVYIDRGHDWLKRWHARYFTASNYEVDSHGDLRLS